MDTNLSPRDNFVTLNKDIVVEARKGVESILIDVDYKVPTSNRVKNTAINKWGNDANVYMSIRGTNMMIFHVKNNACLIIPQKIVTVGGKEINVAERFKKYYFNIDKDDNVRCKFNGKYYKLYRMLYSLILYGDETKRIPEEIEVHHKWRRYNNMTECMVLLNNDEHINVHKQTSQASHRMGKEIRDMIDLVLFIKDMSNCIEFWENRPY